MKVVIVGGVAGGASAAARIRRLDEHAQIIMIERSGYVSYANCGLPYYVGGVIVDRDELTLQTPESFWDRFRIDVRVRQEVTAINPAEKTVTVRALDSGKSYTETYDKLLLAPGAKPTVPALSGISSERVFTLRTVEDTLRIRRFVEDQKPKNRCFGWRRLYRSGNGGEPCGDGRFRHHRPTSKAAISTAGYGYGELCPCGNAQTRRGSAVG